MKFKQILIAAILLVITLSAFYIFNTRSKSDWVVVDVIRLFNKYNLKLDMEKADSMYLQKEFKEIDSVQQIIQYQYKDANHAEQASLAQHYKLLDEKREAAIVASNERINEAVWKKLNALIPQYAKEKKIKVMAGANGMGNVMYYDETYDITDDLIEYVNKAYHDGK